MWRNLVFWILVLIAIASIFLYQQKTGPSSARATEIILNDQTYYLDLPRNYLGADDCPIVLTIADSSISAYIWYRAYPSNDEWTSQSMPRIDNELKTLLPNQPSGNRLEYYIEFENLNKGETIFLLKDNPVILTFDR